jgi:hypothetical protein
MTINANGKVACCSFALKLTAKAPVVMTGAFACALLQRHWLSLTYDAASRTCEPAHEVVYRLAGVGIDVYLDRQFGVVAVSQRFK